MNKIKSYFYECTKDIIDIDLNKIFIEKNNDEKKKLSFQENDKIITINNKIIYIDNENRIELLNIKKIGEGSFSNVYKISSANNKISFILKNLKDKNDPEIKILNALESNQINCNILKAKVISLDIKINNINKDRKIKEKSKKFILAELYNNNLTKLDLTTLEYYTKLDIFKQILDDINCLFIKKFYYTDIKPENILYKCLSNNTIKVVLGDIGGINKDERNIRYFFQKIRDITLSVKIENWQEEKIKQVKNLDYDKYGQIIMIIGLVDLYKFLKLNNNDNNDNYDLNNLITDLNNINIIKFDDAYKKLINIINNKLLKHIINNKLLKHKINQNPEVKEINLSKILFI